MLRELHIENYALIEKLTLSFERGFTVLTGETGAGKSIIVDALGTALGARATADSIRSGQDEARIEAVFEVEEDSHVSSLAEEMGIPPEDGLLILSREISRSGRNRCRINSHVVTLGMLSRISRRLVDIHGQHEHQSLLDPSTHTALLDAFGGAELKEAARGLRNFYERLKRKLETIDELKANARERARRIDILEFQIAEIQAANLRPGEEEELEAQRAALAHAEKLREEAGKAYAYLTGSGAEAAAATDLVGSALASLERAARIDGRLSEIVSALESAFAGVQEAGRDLRAYLETLDFNPRRLEELEARSALISSLKKKYGDSLSEIIEYGRRAQQELEELQGEDSSIARLEDEANAEKLKLFEQAAELTSLRSQAAERLKTAVVATLARLNMKRTQFEVEFVRPEEGMEVNFGPVQAVIGPNGAEQIRFLISPNPGEELKPLARIASGGELSRVMLAIKSALAEIDDIPTVIFDEIDTGIGGRTSTALAAELSGLGRRRQVLVVTHLPQIAAQADHHYTIEKAVVDGRTCVGVRPVRSEERIAELARMLGGTEITETTLSHAREMLERDRSRGLD